MRYIYGFFMAWGCFTAIPCPVKKWDEKYRSAMLETFPLVGTLTGIISCIIWYLVSLAGLGNILTGAVVTAAAFILTGFIHLDGFMDVSDAVLSRRPDIQERQRILKDPHVGSFAVISLAFMLLVFAASVISFAGEFELWKCAMIVTSMTLSRTVSVTDIMRKPAMGTSQYSSMTGGKRAVPAIIAAVICILMCVASGEVINILILAAVMVIAAEAAGGSVRKSLGGMNGDISGYMIVVSETAAMVCIAALSSF